MSHRKKFFLLAVLSFAVCDPAHAGGLPTHVGACAKTRIKSIGTRLEGVPGSGSAVTFTMAAIRLATTPCRRSSIRRQAIPSACVSSRSSAIAPRAMIAAVYIAPPICARIKAGNCRIRSICAAVREPLASQPFSTRRGNQVPPRPHLPIHRTADPSVSEL